MPSPHLSQILLTECFFTSRIVLNGITFSIELWLPNFEDGEDKKIHEIVDVVITQMNDISKIFVICKTFAVAYDCHYGCYRVRMESLQNDLSIINVGEYLSQHNYPVKIHKIQNNHFFRCKRF